MIRISSTSSRSRANQVNPFGSHISNGRFATIDAAKGLAACLIVAHHLTYYGRASDLVMQISPALVTFLYNDARMIVQLFLVISGFGLAWSTRKETIDWTHAGLAFLKRYLRFLVPYSVMLVILIVTALSMGGIGEGNPLVESLSIPQFLTHLLFLQGLLGYENLSAGVWYLCIDLQFAFVFFLLSASIGQLHQRGRLTTSCTTIFALVLGTLGIVSAWYWNLHTEMDDSVFYYFGPFVLGSFVAWQHQGKISSRFLFLYILIVASSLFLSFRPRLVVALLSAITLMALVRYDKSVYVPRFLRWLGGISYSLFLIHYTVCCATMALLDRWMGDSPFLAAVVMVLGFVLSIGAATILCYCVERPALRWLKGRFQAAL